MPGSEKEYMFWDNLANTFEDNVLHIVRPVLYKKVKDWLVNQFRNTDSVIEIGCGTGYFSEIIADKVKRLTGTDLSQNMIEQAKAKLSQFDNVDTRVEDCYDMSFDDNTFDVILLANLLHIVKDPDAVLKECHRVVKGGGRIVIMDCTGYGMSFHKMIGMGFRYMRRFRKPAPYNRNLCPESTAEMAEVAGFTVEESILIGKDTKAVCLRGKKVTNNE